jgi:hypothetical protein
MQVMRFATMRHRKGAPGDHRAYLLAPVDLGVSDGDCATLLRCSKRDPIGCIADAKGAVQDRAGRAFGKPAAYAVERLAFIQTPDRAAHEQVSNRSVLELPDGGRAGGQLLRMHLQHRERNVTGC